MEVVRYIFNFHAPNFGNFCTALSSTSYTGKTMKSDSDVLMMNDIEKHLEGQTIEKIISSSIIFKIYDRLKFF